jgi:hypothetical protein
MTAEPAFRRRPTFIRVTVELPADLIKEAELAVAGGGAGPLLPLPDRALSDESSATWSVRQDRSSDLRWRLVPVLQREGVQTMIYPDLIPIAMGVLVCFSLWVLMSWRAGRGSKP